MRLRVRGGRRLAGQAAVPPDKSILHRALLLGALGRGRSRIWPLGQGEDNRSTLEALVAMGVVAEREADAVVLHGVGAPEGLRAPVDGSLDCGNSGTTLRLLAGVLAAAPGASVVLRGDASLSRRPMRRLKPLESMGARLVPEDPERFTPPLRVEGVRPRGCRHELAIASAQVKSALLLAGVFGEGRTEVIEPRVSRDHTERMLSARGVVLERDGEAPHRVALEGGQSWDNIDAEVPPDLSAATFLLVAAAVTGGEVRVRSGVNPTRAGALEVLGAMGLALRQSDRQDVGGEPVAELLAEGGAGLRATRIDGLRSLRAIDELPVLAGAAAFADGVSSIRDAADLKAKESDRIAETARMLRAFGAEVSVFEDGLDVVGGIPLRPASVHAAGDHRLAMTAVVVALGIEGESVIEGAEVIPVSFPGFVDALKGLGADIEPA